MSRAVFALFAFFLILGTHQVSEAQAQQVDAPVVGAPEQQNDSGLALGFTLELQADFDQTFGQTEYRYDQRVRRLRSIGWTLFGAGWTLFAMSFFVGNKGGIDIDLDEGTRLRLLVGGPTASAGLWLISGALLIRARRLITRRARWRASHSVSLVEPRWDLRVGMGTVEWSLRF